MKRTRQQRLRLLMGLVIGLGLAVPVVMADGAAEVPATQPTTKPAAEHPSTRPVNTMCAVNSEDEVDPDVPTVTYKGRVVGFCCADCRRKFEKDPEKYMEKLK